MTLLTTDDPLERARPEVQALSQPPADVGTVNNGSIPLTGSALSLGAALRGSPSDPTAGRVQGSVRDGTYRAAARMLLGEYLEILLDSLPNAGRPALLLDAADPGRHGIR